MNSIQFTTDAKKATPNAVLHCRKSYLTQEKLQKALEKCGLDSERHIEIQVDGRWTAVFLAGSSDMGLIASMNGFAAILG